MVELSQWFTDQLSSSREGLVWAAGQIPAERQSKIPPKGLGKWSGERHIFHIGFYEQTIAIPSMRQWMGEGMPDLRDDEEDQAWTGKEPMSELLVRFKTVRSEQIAMLPHFSTSDWQRTCDTGWGPRTLLWVVSKTYQHTAEHTSDVLRIALFWDVYASRER